MAESYRNNNRRDGDDQSKKRKWHAGPHQVTYKIENSIYNLPKKLMILDLNKVLIFRQPQTTNFILRPHADAFLEAMSDRFVLAIWTSMTKKCARPIIEDIFPSSKYNLLFTWYQPRCKRIEVISETEIDPKPLFLKELDNVWSAFSQFSAANTVLIDDSAEKCVSNPQHTSIHPHAFELDAKVVFAGCEGRSHAHRSSNRIHLPKVDNNELNIDSDSAPIAQDSELRIGGELFEYLDKISRFDGDIGEAVGQLGSYWHV